MFPELLIKFFVDSLKYAFRKRISLDECVGVVDWVKTQNLPLDTALEFQLPSHLAHITTQGIVQVLHTADDRYCVLLKTHIGWKDNFEGIFYCNKPLLNSEICQNSQGNTCIYIQAKYSSYYFFDSLFISKKFKDNCRFEVYFNLN